MAAFVRSDCCAEAAGAESLSLSRHSSWNNTITETQDEPMMRLLCRNKLSDFVRLCTFVLASLLASSNYAVLPVGIVR